LAIAGSLIKIFPGVVLLWSYRLHVPPWRAIVIAAILILATTVFVGVGQWADFATSLLNARPFGADFPQSPRMYLEPVLGSPLATGATYVATIGVSAAVMFVKFERLAFFLLSLAMILPASEWHIHYLLIPMVGAAPALCAGLGLAIQRRSKTSPVAKATGVRLLAAEDVK
jgi:hypothetical protein